MLSKVLERKKLIRPIGVFKKANQSPIPSSINLSGQNTALSSKIVEEGLKMIENSPSPAFLAPLPSADERNSPDSFYRERKNSISEDPRSLSPRGNRSKRAAEVRRLSS